MAVVAERQRAQSLADCAGRHAGLLGEAQQRRFMRQDELQDTGQKARLTCCLPDRVRLDAGYR